MWIGRAALAESVALAPGGFEFAEEHVGLPAPGGAAVGVGVGGFGLGEGGERGMESARLQVRLGAVEQPGACRVWGLRQGIITGDRMSQRKCAT
jgi:hypothetical protein